MKTKEIEIVFITDSHLVYNEEFLGINTFKSFEAVIEEVVVKHANSDFYIFGGDLIEDQKKESFDFFEEKINKSPFVGKSLFARGNHDINDLFFDRLIKNQSLNTDLKSWKLININTYSLGNIYGEVDYDEIDFLKTISEENKNKNIMIYMHHNLFPTKSPWLDKYITQNYTQISKEISSLTNIKLVVSGHIHQEAVNMIDDTIFISCPSTSFHFVPSKPKYTLDNQNPAYTVFTLFSDGTFDWKHKRVEGYFGKPKIRKN